MATATAPLSIEQYLRTSYNPDADFIDGQLVERNLGEFEHGTLQGAIFSISWSNRKLWNVSPAIEQRIRISSKKVRVVDLGVMRADEPREKARVTPPLICIEILSPEDRRFRAKLVLADYLKMGVANIWLIDPIYRAAFTFDATGLHEADPTHLQVPGTEISLDLTEAFEAID